MSLRDYTPQQIEEILQAFFDVAGTRQYVGARYVPIFGRAGSDTVEWDDGAPYEPLTVVMHEGVSYVSRRYVPKDVQITDTAYWVETYRFNAQVEQYRQEVLGFQDEIDGIRELVESDYVPFPDSAHYPKYGTEGQVLSTLADGTTKWDDPVHVTADVAGPLIEDWLDDHPEATTTVQDGSVTLPKLNANLSNMTHIWRGNVSASSSLNDYQMNGVYIINMSASDYATLTDAPSLSDFGITSPTALMMEVRHGDARNDYGIICQRIYVSGYPDVYNTYMTIVRWGNRSGNNMVWNAWAPESYTCDTIDSKLGIIPFVGEVTVGSDLNSYQKNGTYLLNMSKADFAALTNAPTLEMIGDDPTGLVLEVIHSDARTDYGIIKQIIYCGGFMAENGDNTMLLRNGVRSGSAFAWQPWRIISTRPEWKGALLANTDMNAYQIRGTYIINLTTADYATIANAPNLASFGIASPTALYLEVESTSNLINRGLICQRIKCSGYGYATNEANTIVRYGNYYNGAFTWMPWTIESYTAKAVDAKTGLTVRVGPNRQFTSLLDGILYAEQFMNSKVIVDPGTYDAVAEFKAKYGADYFNSGTYYGKTNFRGIPLINGVHVIGYGGVKITGGLDSDATAGAVTWWSVFNAGDDAGGQNGYGFTLENVTVEATNERIRYLVHDEYGGTDFDYVNRYKNCHFIMPSGVQKACIGGGLGKHAYIDIDGCTVNAPGYASDYRGINYHNNEDSGSLSDIHISNCYIMNGTVGITWYGSTPATEKSILYVSNCKLQHAPIQQAENASAYDIQNVDIVAWNNEVVS